MTEYEKQIERYEMKKTVRRFFMIILLCVALVGMVIALSQPFIHYYLIPHTIHQADNKVTTIKSNKIKDNQERINSMNKKDQVSGTELTPADIDKNISYDPENVTAIDRVPLGSEVNLDYLMGKVIIPNVDVNLPILEGISNDNLNVGVGTMKPGQVMGKGNYAIAGHNMLRSDLLFTPLLRVKKYDDVYITDKSKIYEYIVTNTFVVERNQGEVIDDNQGNKIITMITCYDYPSTKRLVVRGKLVKTYNFADADQELKNRIAS